tara:strand:- start:9134 stop:9598 length:465 start_codon:yes stop_codon:yes gene_type:complete
MSESISLKDNSEIKSIYEGEYKIQKLLINDNNCSAHFEYKLLVRRTINQNEACNLKLITYNPSHKTHFLLHTVSGEDEIDCLEKMYEHIFKLKTTLKKKDSPYLLYSIEWYCPDTSKIVSSSFYGNSIEQILTKFNYGKKEKLVIYNMKLCPTS